MKTLISILCLFFLLSIDLHSQAGTPDSTFGTDGIVTVDVIEVENDFGITSTLQPDGKILTAGTLFLGLNTVDMYLMRHHPDGTLDNSFGNGGIVISDFAGRNEVSREIFYLPDGKILVVGDAWVMGEVSMIFLARYLSDGTLDTTFGNSGYVITELADHRLFVASAAMQADGKLLVTGRSIDKINLTDDFLLARYLPDGTLDASFGNNGIVFTPIQHIAQGRSVLPLPDEKIILVGYLSDFDTADIVLMRYLPDGTIDADFGTDGKVIIDMIGSITPLEAARHAVLQPDGKILVGGAANWNNANFNADIAMLRFNSDGTFDDSFDNDGVKILNLGPFDEISRVTLLPDGKIYAAGPVTSEDFERLWVLTRLLPNGETDTSFGTNGYAAHNFGSISIAQIGDLLIQPDSKVLLTGHYGQNGNYKSALGRFIGDFNMAVSFSTVTCPDGMDGFISIEATGGTPPYEYSLNGVDFQSENTFNNLGPGTYTVTVRDADGTIGVYTSIVLAEPQIPEIELEFSGNSITVNIVPANIYQYSIDGGLTFQQSNIFVDLPNGTYTILVEDDAGCRYESDPFEIDFVPVYETINKIDFDISPNPNNGSFILKTNTPYTGKYKLRITGATGKNIYATSWRHDGSSEMAIDLNFLNNGVYLFFLDDGKNIGVKKLVVKK
ncbi:MAG: T9SS type A sorting domain-containing protein [Bacteroidota bacterium]